jgi:hypothetical protein
MNQDNLNSFLAFGYFLDYKPKINIDLSGIDKSKYESVPEPELIKIGGDLWREAIDKNFEPEQKHVVPLSGGLDSRAILAGLLEFTDAENIYTYTFGVPGAYDYDIGSFIAKKIGTKHTIYDLSKYHYSQDELEDISKRVDFQTILFHHPPVWEVDKKFNEMNVWSGAIIDVFFGRHFHQLKAKNWNDAIQNSFKENIYVKSVNLMNCSFDSLFDLVDYNEDYINIFEFEHIIDLLNRQIKFIAPHVLMKGYSYKLLFNNDLSRFSSSIPNHLRENQYLYKKIFLSYYPDFFALKTKTNYGMTLKTDRRIVFLHRLLLYAKRKLKIFSNPMINYIDFNRGIREREDLKNIIYSNIMDLKQRKIVDWIDIDGIWKRHINKQANHADALIVLASLEIHLKAGKRI